MTEDRPWGTELAGRRRAVLRVVQLAALGVLALYAAITAFATDGGPADEFAQGWLYGALMATAAALCLARAALVRTERRAWLALGLGVAAWSAGEIYYAAVLASQDNAPYPSLADALYLSFYPASYIGLVLLVRGRMGSFQRSVWMDGAIGTLAVAAVGTALLLQPVIDATEGSGLSAATDLAYPLADVLLIALAVGVFALTGWRPGRAWGFIGASLAATAIADGLFLYLLARDGYTEASLLDALWPASVLLLAYAAWQPSRLNAPIRLEGWRVLVIPSAFALTALAVLVYDHFSPVSDLAAILAAATLAVVVARTAITFRENLAMLAQSRHQALTDALTGLGNRRRLITDLGDELLVATSGRPRTLAMFDLDGFKRYNDTYGHPAGDALLARLGANLRAAVAGRGYPYRLGGDEFCVLITAQGEAGTAVVAAAEAALTSTAGGVLVGASCGLVSLPTEAADPAEALQVADQRLYARKGGRRRTSVTEQTRDVLLQVLREREPDLRAHLDDVARLAVATGRRLGLMPEALDELARAAELHDVGKMAVPDVVLRKPGPLNAVEWSLMREHTLAGERMLQAAPALGGVAEIVRASHERFDGAGYPDGVAGEAIPLGARIVSVCDAYEAMISRRPYAPEVSSEEALAELRRCSGTQFDPRVVTAFCEKLAENPDATAPARSERTVLPRSAQSMDVAGAAG